MASLKQKFVWPLIAGIVIGAGSYFGTTEFNVVRHVQADTPAETAKPAAEPRPEAIAPANDLSRAFRSVHAALKDAVVNINVSKKAPAVARGNRRIQIPEEFRNMLPPGVDPDDIQPMQPGQQQQPEISGTGSGVIVSADGYILTNNHVVSDADEVKVTLNDGRELDAKVVGTDPKSDLAVIRVKADKLTYARFGDSDALEVGDWVLAFGSPFGFSQTVTQGIISAKGRHFPIIAAHNPQLARLTYENFLQTDAAINPGNSGGPLVNLKGEVVGINSAIASNTGSYNGIGFSIPSNDAKYIMDALIKHGKVVRGFLGVGIEDVNNPAPNHKGLVASIKRAGYTSGKGVLIGEVNVGGPGANAGLQAGDVVTAIDNKPVDEMNALRNQIARTTPGTKINLTVFRDGKTLEVPVTVGTQPDSLAQLAGGVKGDIQQPDAADSDDLGIRVEDLTAKRAKSYRLDEGKGVVVSEVSPNGVAAEMGLKPGDVITKVDRTDVTSAKSFTDALSKAKLADGVKLVVRTEDGMDRLVYIEKK